MSLSTMGHIVNKELSPDGTGKKKGINWYKVAFWTALAIIIFMIWNSCGKGRGFLGCKVPYDTLSHKIDTVIQIEEKVDTHYVPKPYAVIEWRTKEITRTDSFITYEPFPSNIDSLSQIKEYCKTIIDNYFSSRVYPDTIRQGHGTVILADTISRNQIVGRRVQINAATVTVKETITIAAPPRITGYIGAELIGKPKDPFLGGKIDLSIQLKNQMIYTVGTGLIRDHGQVYTAGAKLPIRIKRKK